MKKVIYYVATCCLFIAMFSSCSPSVEFEEELLLGKWENNDNKGEYWVYTTETTTDGNYQYGRTWDENDDVYESDLIPYGNGWFKWQLVKSDLTQIHLMDNQGGEIPKIYTVTILTSTTLTYKDETTGRKTSFTKIQ